ncbi:MAG: chromate transporter [Clostridia bacterium]
MNTLILLGYEFFKVGLFTIGGGLAALPFLYEIAEKYTWFTAGMLADMIAVSESTPGPIAINMATYAGFHADGLLGSLVATVSILIAPFIIASFVYKFLQVMKSNQMVQDAFYGLRPVVCALIAYAGWAVFKISVLFPQALDAGDVLHCVNWGAAIFFTVCAVLNKKFKWHPIVYIVAGAVFGIVFSM